MTFYEEFFRTARERYAINLRRQAGQEWPWTDDDVFREWRFCNVHREDDKTTVWFRENVRSKLDYSDAINATLIFRWFNRVEVGEIIRPLLLAKWSTEEARRLLEGVKPIVTGAYMVRTPSGFSKLDGVLCMIDQSLEILASGQIDFDAWTTLRAVAEDLRRLPGIGKFMAYEIVTDLRWTPVLRDAPDIMTWASAGPGCAKGLGRVVDGNRRRFDYHHDQDEMCVVMRQLLEMSRDSNCWPSNFRPWEMREVEHWACEFEKYQRAAVDGCSLKRRYNR